MACMLNFKGFCMTLSEQDFHQIETFFNNCSTRCIGLYLIDLPDFFTISSDMTFFYQEDDFKISTRLQYLPPYKQMLTRLEKVLRETLPVNPHNSPYLKNIYPIYSNDTKGVIFERMESISVDDFQRVLEAYYWKDGITLKIETQATNGLSQKYDDERSKYPEIYINDVNDKIIEINQIVKRLKIRDDLTIPNEPGICLLGCFMQEIDSETKYFSYCYSHKDDQNFNFSFEYNDYIPNIDLFDYSEEYFTQERGKTVYKESREINGLKTQEWVIEGCLFEDENELYSEKYGYIFTLAIHMTDPSYITPNMIIRMNYQISDDCDIVYSKEQLIAIWNKVTDSIKMRQVI